MANIADIADIFRIVGEMAAWGPAKGAGIPAPGSTEDPPLENYLKRGERILSLLKEKSRKSCTKRPILSLLSKKGMQGDGAIPYALKRIQKKVAEPALQEACKSGDMGGICGLYPGVPISIAKLSQKSAETDLVKASCRQKCAIGIGIRYGEGASAVTCLNYPVRKKYRHTISCLAGMEGKGGFYIVDFAEELSKWILVSQTIQYMQGSGNGETGGIIGESIRAHLKDAISRCTEDGTLCLSSQIKGQKGFTGYLEELGVPYRIAEPMGAGKALCYADTVAFDLWQAHAITGPWQLKEKCLPAIVGQIFCQVYGEHSKDVRTQSFLRNVGKEYAHVYETKKGIPKKTLKAMEQSGFNDFFGYVEFDSGCSMESVGEIELEFRAMQGIFSQGRHEEVSLRFRRLGRHKASGLYFPTLKCLCVDVRVPSSMAHEYLHMIDYEHGGLSRQAGFQPIYQQYVSLLESAVSKMGAEDPMKSQWGGRAKYNKDYYTEPTEVFARCGEIYLTAVRGVRNSICSPNGGFAYPSEKSLLAAISEYYGSLFGAFSAGGGDAGKGGTDGSHTA